MREELSSTESRGGKTGRMEKDFFLHSIFHWGNMYDIIYKIMNLSGLIMAVRFQNGKHISDEEKVVDRG